MKEQKSDGVLMAGLDGSNPLAFIAALGTLRILSKKAPEKRPRLAWEVTQGAWRPRISGFSQAADLLSVLTQNLIRDRKNHPTEFVGEENIVAEFYTAVRNEIPLEFDDSYWFASLANDVHTNATSQLQLTRRDYFAGNLDVILRETTPGTWKRHFSKLGGMTTAFREGHSTSCPLKIVVMHISGTSRTVIQREIARATCSEPIVWR
ncbi:MAG TPA: hypothetical protein VG326_11785 [Tepidisphaeraceae bacterium]|jgi:hypothetical protein|nr:hypothetical protein [Tepidisphaeraceae bacterium]